MTDKHPCPLCGRDMFRDKGPRGTDDAEWVCPATPDQHELAALRLERDTLKRELAGVKESFTAAQARVKELEEDNASWKRGAEERTRQIESLGAQVLALRSALEWAKLKFDQEGEGDRMIDAALTSTADAADQVRREILERAFNAAWLAFSGPDAEADNYFIEVHWKLFKETLCAAILGEGEGATMDELPGHPLDKCPQCGGPADNGHDRCLPPNPYLCTKCSREDAP